MKNLNKTLIVSIVVLSLGLIGCSGNNSSRSNKVTTVPTVTPTVLPGTLPTTTTSTGQGVVIDISVDSSLNTSFSALAMELNIGNVIGEVGELDSKQGGDIIMYKTSTSGQQTQSFFTSGGNVLEDVQENFWQYNSDNKLVWRGAFEGPTGTLVVVVDGVYKSGDGSDPFNYMSGSVWFRPWPIVEDDGINSQKCYMKDGRLDCKNPSGPLARCWKVSLGPYDCRFTVSDDSKTVTAVGNQYSTEEYVKIGTFINLNKQKTFKETY